MRKRRKKSVKDVEVSEEVFFQTYGMKYVREEIEKRDWFGFDLDNTLHNLWKASWNATLSILMDFGDKHGIFTDNILGAHTKSVGPSPWLAVVGSETWKRYCRAELSKMLGEMDINPVDSLVEGSFGKYRPALEEELKLRYGESLGIKGWWPLRTCAPSSKLPNWHMLVTSTT